MVSIEKQMEAFRASMASAAQSLPKRTVAAPSSSTSRPSPAPEVGRDQKRKRPEPSMEIYSQPADTGTGTNIMTQVTYAVNHLKTKTTPLKLDDLLSYLSAYRLGDDYIKTLSAILMRHPKIIYDPKGFDGAGSFEFRPMHNIRNGDQLLGHLQGQTTAAGLPVKELLEGWPDVQDAIRALEKEHKLLVIRNKKDDHARTVWADDPTLAQHVDDAFQDMWFKIKLPDAELLISELEKNGLTPTNKSAAPKPKPKVQEKKTKKARKSGKTTNTHMVGILRDYSHLKK
jgi:transcription initiation factor TFIIE subunit beta